LIPYVELLVITIGPISIPVFSLLGSVGVAVALWRGGHRAQRVGVWPLVRHPFPLWVIGGGLTGAILFKLLYYPHLFESGGLAEVFRFRGIASFGAAFGGLVGTWIHCARRGLAFIDALRIADVMSFVFPLSWAIGRLGCTLVHDHPGIRSDSWLAVRYPDWPRYALGLLGMLFLLALAAAFQLLDRKPRPAGFFTAAALISVGLFRFGLDRLQIDPPRYFGWSVDQYNAALVLALGAALIPIIRKRDALEAA
jgi:phosphatidylglycerol---prolipoprotein diacylglyceryl transferase